jgi:DNA polymerase-1
MIRSDVTTRFMGEPVRVVVVDRMDDIPRDWRATAFDTESTGLDWHAPTWRLRLAQLADCSTAYVIPAESYRPGRERKTWAHNASFDALSMLANGTSTELYDSENLARIADPKGFEIKDWGSGQTIRRHGLKFHIKKHLDPEYDADKMLLDRFHELGFTKANGFKEIPLFDPVYTLYAGLDAIAVARLVRMMKPMLTVQQRELFLYEHALQQLTIGMSWRGMNVDEEAKQGALRQLDDTYAHHAEWLDAAGWPLDTRKADDRAVWSERLTALGVELPVSRKTGNVSLDKKRVQKIMAAFDPMSEPRQAWMHIGAAKTALDHPTRYIAKFDGRVHPKLKSMGTLSARITASDPPLQQLPTSGPIRPCLCADDGYVLLPADSGQIEFRTAAGLSQDRVMLIAVQADDMYSFVSNLLRGRRDIKKGMPERNIDKVALLAHMYGAGPDKLAMIMNCILEESEGWVRAFRRTFPGLAQYFRELSYQEYIDLPNGFRVPVDPMRRYSAGNYAMQTTARYMHSDMILKLAHAGLSERLWLTVHDEIILHIKPCDVPEVERLIDWLMLAEIGGVTIPVERQTPNRNWVKAA